MRTHIINKDKVVVLALCGIPNQINLNLELSRTNCQSACSNSFIFSFQYLTFPRLNIDQYEVVSIYLNVSRFKFSKIALLIKRVFVWGSTCQTLSNLLKLSFVSLSHVYISCHIFAADSTRDTLFFLPRFALICGRHIHACLILTGSVSYAHRSSRVHTVYTN